MLHPSPTKRGVPVCLLLCVLIAVADLAHGTEKTQYVGLLVGVPFLAATFGSAGLTTWLGGAALLTGGLIGALNEDGGTMPQYVRLGCIVLATALAAYAARSREKRERRLVAVQSAADAASRAILRPLPPVLGGVPISVDYVSASEESRIGGDLYEAVQTPRGLRLVVGDVRGKGLEAVRLAAVTLGSFREAAHRDADLDDVAAAMHEAVSRDAGPEDFVTALLVEIAPDGVRMLSCGHPHPLLLRPEGASELALPSQPPLGIGLAAGPVDVGLERGDRVLLYTDGAIEARQGERWFDLPDAACQALCTGPLAPGLAQLGQRLRSFCGGAPSDDVAFLVFELAAPALVPAPR